MSMKNTEAKHDIVKADPDRRFTYCTVCGRDVSLYGEVHYRTAAAKIAKRMEAVR